MIENIEGLKTCKCGGDSLPNKTHMTDVGGKSVEVLICPECGGQPQGVWSPHTFSPPRRIPETISMSSNPPCPECQGTTQKWGTYPARSGRVQKYKCTSCGKVFTQPQGNGTKSEE